MASQCMECRPKDDSLFTVTIWLLKTNSFPSRLFPISGAELLGRESSLKGARFRNVDAKFVARLLEEPTILTVTVDRKSVQCPACRLREVACA